MIPKTTLTTKKNYFKGKNDLLICKKLAKAFKLGLSDEDACYFVDIQLYELRQYEQSNPQLKERKAKLKKQYQLMQKEGGGWLSGLVQKNGKRIGQYNFAGLSLDCIAERYGKKLDDLGLEKDERSQQNALQELKDMENRTIQTMNLETKELMLKAIPLGDGYKGFALELAKSLERDFEAKTATEKSLIQMATLAFVSYLHTNYEVQQNSYLRDYSDEQRTSTGYLMAVSKEKNNALRQYTTIIQTLKNLRASPIKLNIVANTLNMGQQQQINNTTKA